MEALKQDLASETIGPTDWGSSGLSNTKRAFSVRLNPCCMQAFEELVSKAGAPTTIWGDQSTENCIRATACRQSPSESNWLTFEVPTNLSDCLKPLSEVLNITQDVYNDHNLVLDESSFRMDLLKPLSIHLENLPLPALEDWLGKHSIVKQLKAAFKSKEPFANCQVILLLLMLKYVLKKPRANPEQILDLLSCTFKLGEDIDGLKLMGSPEASKAILEPKKVCIDALVDFLKKAITHLNVVKLSSADSKLEKFLRIAGDKYQHPQLEKSGLPATHDPQAIASGSQYSSSNLLTLNPFQQENPKLAGSGQITETFENLHIKQYTTNPFDENLPKEAQRREMIETEMDTGLQPIIDPHPQNDQSRTQAIHQTGQNNHWPARNNPNVYYVLKQQEGGPSVSMPNQASHHRVGGEQVQNEQRGKGREDNEYPSTQEEYGTGGKLNTGQPRVPRVSTRLASDPRVEGLTAKLHQILDQYRVVDKESFVQAAFQNNLFTEEYMQMNLLQVKQACMNVPNKILDHFMFRNKKSDHQITKNSKIGSDMELYRTAVFDWLAENSQCNWAFYCLHANLNWLDYSLPNSRLALISQMHLRISKFSVAYCDPKTIPTWLNSILASQNPDEKRISIRTAFILLTQLKSGFASRTELIPGLTICKFLVMYLEELKSTGSLSGQDNCDQHLSLMRNFDSAMVQASPHELEPVIEAVYDTMKEVGGHFGSTEQMISSYILMNDGYPEFIRNQVLKLALERSFKDFSYLDKFLDWFCTNGRSAQQKQLLQAVIKYLESNLLADPKKTMLGYVANPEVGVHAKVLEFVSLEKAKSLQQVPKLLQDFIISLHGIFTELVMKKLPCKFVHQLHLAETATLKLFELCDKLYRNYEQYVPQHVNKDAILKILSSNKGMQLKAHDFSNLLEKLTDSKELAFINIDQKELQEEYVRMKDDINVNAQAIESLQFKFKQSTAIFKCSNLITVKCYQDRLRENSAESAAKQRRGKLSLQEFEQVCLDAENHLKTELRCFLTHLHGHKIKDFLKLREDLGTDVSSNDKANVLVQNQIITEEERIKLIHVKNLVYLFPTSQLLIQSLGAVLDFLKRKNKISKHSGIQDDKQEPFIFVALKTQNIGKAVELHTDHKGSPVSGYCFEIYDQFSPEQLEILSFFHEHESFLLHLGNCMPALQHFADKEPRHFQDMYFESEGPIKIEPQVTHSAETLVSVYKKADYFKDLREFCQECVKKKQQIETNKLAATAKDLIECSKILLSDNLDGKNSAFQILEKSVIVFQVHGSWQEYEVYCRTNTSLRQAFDELGAPELVQTARSRGIDAGRRESQRDRQKYVGDKPQDSRISFEKLKDTKIKVSLYKEHLRRQKVERKMLEMQTEDLVSADTRRIDLFQMILESVESISNSLVKILRTGMIYDLEPVINQIGKELYNGRQTGRKHTSADMTRALSYSKRDGLSLCVQTNTDQSDSEESAAIHFLILQEIFAAIEQQSESLLLSRQLKYHNISYLRSAQKIMLCRYLAFCEVGFFQPHHNQPQDLAELHSIFKHMLPMLPAFEKNSIKKWQQKCSNWKDFDGFTGTLLEAFHRIAALDFERELGSDLQVRKLKPTDDEKNQPTKVKKIKYFVTSEDDQYKSMWELANLKGEKRMQPQRVFFANQSTTIYDIKNFLICALTDPQEKFYCMLDLNLLTPEMQGELILVSKSLLENQYAVVNDNLTLMVVSQSNRFTELGQHLARNSEFFTSDAQEQGSVLEPNLPGFEVVTSTKAGLGKTTSIEKRASRLCTLFLSGDTCKEGISRRLSKLAQVCREQSAENANFVLHIKLDSMDDMQVSCKYVDQFLFNAIYLKCIPFQQGYIFLQNIKATFVELQNSYRDLLLKEVKMLRFAKRNSISNLTVKSFMSSFDPQLVSPRTSSQQLTHEQSPLIWQFLNAFVTAFKNNSFGQKCIQMDEAQTERGLSREASAQLVLDLFSLISMKPQAVETLISKASYTQINYWLNTVYFQLAELNTVSGLNPAFHLGHEATIRSLAEIRIRTAKSVIDLAKQLVWNVAECINEEVALAKKLTQNANSNKGESGMPTEKELKEYEKVVKSIPRWELGSQVNFFFFKGSMKVIYQDPERVDASIRDIVKNQTNQVLLDYRQMPDASEKLTEELLQALSMENNSGLLDWLSQQQNMKAVSKDTRIKTYIKDKMNTFNGKGYAITHDSYMKILMIVQRALLHIPIVIMGGTGCGKTYMIDFISVCLFRELFECFTMHTGVSEADLTKKLLQVCRLASEHPNNRIWFLFDEFNTSPLQCLIAEIIIERRSTFCRELQSVIFPPNIVFVAACNPYRIKAQTSEVGLIHESSVSLLSHRVYPIPESLISNIWDFGQLTKEVEEKYILSMINSHPLLKQLKIKQDITKSIQICQEYFRNGKCENTVSLRDVNRFIELFTFLDTYFTKEESLVVTVSLCYVFRLETKSQKIALYNELDQKLRRNRRAENRGNTTDTMDEGPQTTEVEPTSSNFADTMDQCMKAFAADLRQLGVLPEGVILNKALLENLIATWICILTNTPLIICGKPGTSKTLSVRIIGDALNLQHGRRAESIFFGNAPRVNFRNFWGSLTTTSNSILKIFEKASSVVVNINHLQQTQQSEKSNVCVVFDEIGLAEIAPDNPLKVLHPLLEPKERKVGFIGLSNWRLDLSKMNRVLYVARPDMDAEDLLDTCDVSGFLSKIKQSHKYKKIIQSRFEALSRAYFKFRVEEMSQAGPGTHPNFHGSRDFYETVKIFKRNFKFFTEENNKEQENGSEELELEDQYVVEGLLFNAIQRNFSGKMIKDVRSHEVMMRHFQSELRDFTKNKVVSAPAIELIYQNLIDEESRHLMILSSMNVVQDLIVKQISQFETDIRHKDSSKIVSLAPSKDKEDMIQVIKSKLPVYIKNGYTVIMKDLHELYGCMYDLLNMNYTKRVEEGENACDLFIDNISQQVTVHPEFKCIILMDELDKTVTGKDIEKKQQPPFFNRFEKYIITEEDYIPKEYAPVKDRLLERLQFTKSRAGTNKRNKKVPVQALYHNLSREMVFSIVVKDTSEVKQKLKFEYKDKYSILKLLLEQSTNYCKASHDTQSDMQDSGPDNEEEIEEKAIRLLSRNSLLYFALKPAEASGYSDFHNKFMRTHPHNSLQDLQIYLDSQPNGKRAVVFTYSSGFELREIVNGLPNVFQLIEANELYTRYTSRQESCFREILTENNKTLVVQFSRKQDWPRMQQIKFGIDKALDETKSSRVVIFVAQYVWGDFNLPLGEFHCGITYFTTDWQMHVIDDLKGCDYEKFLHLIQKRCHEVLVEDSGHDMLQDAISPYFLHGSKTFAEGVRGDACRELISKTPSLLGMIKQRTLDMINMGQKQRAASGKDTILGLLQDKEDLFYLHNDCIYLVKDALKNLFVTETQKSIENVEQTVNIRNLILLKNIRPDLDKYAQDLLVNSTAVGFGSKESTTANSVMENTATNLVLSGIKSAVVDSGEIAKAMRRYIAELQTNLAVLSQVSEESAVANYFAKFKKVVLDLTKKDFEYFQANKRLTETRDASLCLLAAIHHFKLFMENHSKELLGYPIFEIILHVGSSCLQKIFPQKSQACDYSYKEAVVTLILVSRVYIEEFGAVNSYIQGSSETARELEGKLKEQIGQGVMSKGVIDLQDYIESIQRLVEIPEKDDYFIRNQINRIRLSYKLALLLKHRKSRGLQQIVTRNRPEETEMDTGEEPEAQVQQPGVSATFSDHQMIIIALEFVELQMSLRQQQIVEIYNYACSSLPLYCNRNPFQDEQPEIVFLPFVLEFFQKAIKSAEISLVACRDLLTKISSHLLDLDQHQPGEYFDQIATVFLLIINRILERVRPQEAWLSEHLDLDADTMPEIILLAKLALFNISNNSNSKLGQQPFNRRLDMVIEQVFSSWDSQTKTEFYKKLNHRIICFAGASAQRFLSRIPSGKYNKLVEQMKTISKSLFEVRQPRVFDYETISSFAVFKCFLQDLKEGSSLSYQTISSVDQECGLFADTNRRSETDKKFGLVVYHAIYSAVPSIRRLKKSGMSQLVATLQKLHDSSSKEFILPVPELQAKVDALLTVGSMNGFGLESDLNLQVQNFHIGIRISNFFFASNPSLQEIQLSLSRIPQGAYKSYVLALLKNGFGQSNLFENNQESDTSQSEIESEVVEIETQVVQAETEQPENPLAALRTVLNNPNQATPVVTTQVEVPTVPVTSVIRRLEALQDNSLKENLHFYLCVGLVLNFLSDMPESVPYSPSRLGPASLKEFEPMLNYPHESVLKYQLLDRYHQLTRKDVGSAEGRQFTQLWECATQNCGYLIPIGDCGELGHGNTDNISGKCLGCGKPIGALEYGKSNLIKRDKTQILNLFNEHLRRDELPFRREPKTAQGRISDKFDEGWILLKYFEEIKDRSTALFVNFVQNIILYSRERTDYSHLLTLQKNRMTETELLLVRDYEILRDLLARDDQTIFEIFNLVLFKAHNHIHKKAVDAWTPKAMRALLANYFAKVALPTDGKKPSLELENYYALRQQTHESEKSRNKMMMAFLSGKLPVADIRTNFEPEQIYGFYLNKAEANVDLDMIDTKLLETIKSEAGSDPEVIQRYTFIQLILNNQRVLESLRPILIGLRRFSMFLVQRYDSLFTKNEAREKSIGELMISKSTRHNRSTESVIGERLANSAEDLEEEYIALCNLIENQVLKQEKIVDQIRRKYRFECQKIENALDSIKSLLDKKAPLISFLIYEERTADDPEPILKLLMEALIEFQTNWMTNFGGIDKTLMDEKKSSFHVNLLTCQEESVMCLPADFKQDLFRHSYANTIGLNCQSTLVIDVNFLSNKYASCLFGQSNYLKVQGLFSFQDSSNRHLTTLVKRFIEKYKITPEENEEEVAPLNIGSTDIKSLVTTLKLLLAQAVDSTQMDSDSTMQENQSRLYHDHAKLSVLNHGQLGLFSSHLANYSMRDLKVLRRMIAMAEYPELIKIINHRYPVPSSAPNSFCEKYKSQIQSYCEKQNPFTADQKTLKQILCSVVSLETVDESSTMIRLQSAAEDSLEESDMEEFTRLLDKLEVPPHETVTLRDLIQLVELLSVNI